MASLSAWEAARKLREAKNKRKEAADAAAKAKKNKKVTNQPSNKGKSQTNKKYKQDYDKLQGASKSQIEEIRRALKAGKKVKAKK